MPQPDQAGRPADITFHTIQIRALPIFQIASRKIQFRAFCDFSLPLRERLAMDGRLGPPTLSATAGHELRNVRRSLGEGGRPAMVRVGLAGRSVYAFVLTRPHQYSAMISFDHAGSRISPRGSKPVK